MAKPLIVFPVTMDFLTPFAWFGLLALAVPAVLHLRRPPPPTVKVGTLRHLDALLRRRVQWWRWRDQARLALRLALLAFLVAALARPLWRRTGENTPQRWALVDPAGTLVGPSRERLDARRAAGDRVRLLAEGFPESLAGTSAQAPVNIWSLLRELDARLPVGSSLTVFSPARLDSLRGERPTLGNVAVEWVETPAADLPEPPAPRPAPALRAVILHTPDRAADARRLAAALRAAVPPTGTHPEAVVAINPGRDARPTAPVADWVFCLGGDRPEALAEEAGVAANARNLFTDSGNASPVDEDGTGPGLLVAPELSDAGVLVRQRVSLPAEPAAAVHWTDNVGRPVLTVTRSAPAGPRRWRFGSRFDPAWSDLPATTALTEVLREWCFPEPPGPTAAPRLAGAEQARPRQGAAGAHPAWPWPGDGDGVTPVVDLRPWALALAAAGFLLERLWALWRRPAAVFP